MDKHQSTKLDLTLEQQLLNDLWEEHLRGEFNTHDTDATIDTMVADAYVNHVPVLTGGVGHNQLREFYSRHFIPTNAAGYGNRTDLTHDRSRTSRG